MSKTKTKKKRKPLVLSPGKGRVYSMGRIRSVFKADGAETGHSYSVSEWWMAPNTQGPHAHRHDEDHVYYVLEGTMSVLIHKKWIHLSKGSVVVIPEGTLHTFENRDKKRRAGILSFNNRSGFEEEMPAIVDWFAQNPAGRAT